MPATKWGSLYDDWLARREKLLDAARAGESISDATHLKVLEFLLNRYHGTDAAAQAAVFPLPRDVVLNSRAIILHHHLAKRVALTAVKSGVEATAKVGAILQKMRDPERVVAGDEPWPGPATLWTPKSRRAKHIAEQYYLALASEKIAERALGLQYILASGTLTDTSLLSDLAALPLDADFDAMERRAILHVMRSIGGGREQ